MFIFEKMNISAIFQQLPSNKSVKPKGTAGRKSNKKDEAIASHPEILKSAVTSAVTPAVELKPSSNDETKTSIVITKRKPTTKRKRNTSKAERKRNTSNDRKISAKGEAKAEPNTKRKRKPNAKADGKASTKAERKRKAEYKEVKLPPEQIENVRKMTEYVNTINENRTEALKEAKESERIQLELLRKAKAEEIEKKPSEAVDSFTLPVPVKIPDDLLPTRAINRKMERNKYIMTLYTMGNRERYLRGVLNEYIRNR